MCNKIWCTAPIFQMAYSSEGIRGTNEKTKRIEDSANWVGYWLESCDKNTSAAETTTQ